MGCFWEASRLALGGGAAEASNHAKGRTILKGWMAATFGLAPCALVKSLASA